jgi:hypothetical protein
LLIRKQLIIPPVDLPLSDIEARIHLRNPENTEDVEILSFIAAADVGILLYAISSVD